MTIIGLTGSMGTGKTTVSDIFKRRGIKVIDADEISREITRRGSPMLGVLAERFGSEIIKSDGSLDRKKLASIVFASNEKLCELNDIMHPRIINDIKERIAEFDKAGEKLLVLDAPLLLETGLDKLVDLVLLVTCDSNVQIERIMERDDMTRTEAESRLAHQMCQEDKKRLADFILDNSGTVDELEAKVDDFLEGLEVCSS
ncbi:MAG: dephospho-CoA kinase [Peptoclostridium sp.]|uniref:dephospho-CoA kinase n=1 Tax=Peptoclostridium sp. TaxID=1904860 RepID=UPI00139D3F8F|nr:dephospho-CoA kinase [Peptoclostridium sp.]MZQ76041.1 dephospho-CoA kinase [Peptoclostridium sp.]